MVKTNHNNEANQRPAIVEDHLRLVIDTIPGFVWSATPDGSIEFLNQRGLDYTGFSLEQIRGWNWKDTNILHPDDIQSLFETWSAIVACGEPGEIQARMRRFDGEYRWFLFRVAPLRDELGRLVAWWGIDVEIHERKNAEDLLAGEKRLLEMVAKGDPLASVLEALCQLVEETARGSLCSILLIDPNGSQLRHAAAPSLALSYIQWIDGRNIALEEGPCASAAFSKEPVIASDFESDDRWLEEYRALALAHGLRACWSTPILSQAGTVLGTFALYYREPGSPTPKQQNIIDQFTHLASIAIERTRTETALKESEERFRQMADTIPEVIWITNLEPEKVLYASPSFERIWGFPVGDLYRNPRLWTETIHPEDRARVSNLFSRWVAGEGVNYHDVEFRIVQPNGAIRWIHERGVLSRNEQGKPYRVSGISTDVTERKRAEEELRRSEAYLAEAQRLSLTGSFGWNVVSGELFWSEETFCIIGYDRVTNPTLELVLNRVHPEDVVLVQETFERASRDGADVDFELRFLMPDGVLKYVHVLAHAVRQESGNLEYIGAVTDVTAKKQAEEKIRQDERELRQIVDAIPQLIAVLSPGGKILYANELVLEYSGLGFEDVMADDFRLRLFHPDDLERLRDERQHGLEHGVPFQLEMRTRRKDGVYRWFLIYYKPLLDGQGRILRWYASGAGICHRELCSHSAILGRVGIVRP